MCYLLHFPDALYGYMYIISVMLALLQNEIAKKFLVILIMFYGITPYFAQMSIAMWKDPIFSVTLAVLTVMLMDVLLSKGKL